MGIFRSPTLHRQRGKLPAETFSDLAVKSADLEMTFFSTITLKTSDYDSHGAIKVSKCGMVRASNCASVLLLSVSTLRCILSHVLYHLWLATNPFTISSALRPSSRPN